MSERSKLALRAGAVSLLLLASAVTLIWLSTQVGVVEKQDHAAYFTAQGMAWVCALGAAFLARKLPPRALLGLLLLGSVLLGATGLSNRPISSTDSARYNWDGIVQKAGVDPYLRPPAAKELSSLRPSWLFVERVRGERCPKFYTPAQKPGEFSSTCTAINRPLVPTIYPPVAEALFTLVRLPVPNSVTYLPTQLLGLAAMLAAGMLLVSELRRRKENFAWAALWAWSPFVVTESVNASHIDGTAACLALAATILIVRQKRLWGGIVLGLAIATKFLPVIVAPPLIRRRPLSIILPAAGVVLAAYLPHLIAVGGDVLGYLPGYLSEEGYDSGSRSVLMALILPGKLATFGAAIILLVIALAVMRKADPANPYAAQVVIIAAALTLTSPKYGWYALLLLPFLVLAKRPEWLPLIVLLAVNQYSGELRPWLPWLLLGQIALATWAALRRRAVERRAESDCLWRASP